jgi:CBS domain-containing protein
MTSPAIIAGPETTLLDIARLMLDHRISAVPIVDGSGALAGLVSEGDLVRRAEIGVPEKHSWWLSMFGNATVLAEEFIKSHGVTAKEVMTRQVVSATEDTPLWEIAELLEKKKIKRVPILRDGEVVGIVSRANLLQALTVQKDRASPAPTREDSAIREELIGLLRDEPWAKASHINVLVSGGTVHLWGSVRSESQRKALTVAAKGIAGVGDVVNHAHVSLTLL